MSELKTKALALMPKGILFNLIKTKMTEKAKFEVLIADIKIDYEKNQFTCKFKNAIQRKQITKIDKADEYSELSDVLIMKIKKKINAKKIDKINLIIDLVNKSTQADVYYLSAENEFSHIKLDELF